MTNSKDTSTRPEAKALGGYLAEIRKAKRLTLRQVEEGTDHAVSNAYLSQLENGRINKPSPSILHSLASVYGISYETLMEKAGYITASSERSADEAHGRVATFAGEILSSEEEEELISYLAYLRTKKKR